MNDTTSNPMKVRTALFVSIRGGSPSPFHFEPGSSWYRVSEWVEIEFRPVATAELQQNMLTALTNEEAYNARAVESLRSRIDALSTGAQA